jgi:two-component system LytT family sensor kinase
MPAQHLLILLVKLAVAASLASILTRSSGFQRMLMREERTLTQRVKMALVCALIYGAGVAVRVAAPPGAYQAVDLGMEGSLVMGMLGGYVTGLVAGVFIAIPSLFESKPLTILLFAAAGVMGGLLRDLAPDKEFIWKFTPDPTLASVRLLRRGDLRLAGFSIACVGMIVLAEVLRSTLASVFPAHGVFALQESWDDGPWLTVAAYATTLFAVALPIKIWDSNLNEKRLEQQQLRLNEARLAALSSQINPHFLFNTLNSVASLIRLNPEQARQVVYKLSKILRRLLRQQDNLITLGEELSFIDDYLAIEMVRFDKLRFVKEVEPDTLDLLVPSMLLQPLVENSIRHGLASKVDGGTIKVRSRRQGTQLQILVEDDGVGIPESRLARMFEQGGIGVTNVNERLKVLYGDNYRMWIDSRPGEGTSTGIEIPEQVSGTVVGVESLVGSG